MPYNEEIDDCIKKIVNRWKNMEAKDFVKTLPPK